MLAIFILGVVSGIFRLNLSGDFRSDILDNDFVKTAGTVVYKSGPRDIFAAVKLIIDRNYVEKIDDKLYDKMSVYLTKGMLKSLADQRCRYVDREEMAMIDRADKGEFEGIGIRTDVIPVDVNGIEEEKMFVASVIPQSPAYKAGLLAGDMIISIDGKEILPYNPLSRAEKILNEFQLKPDKSKINEVQKKIEDEYSRIEKGISVYDAEKLVSFNADKPLKIKTDRSSYTVKTSQWKLEPVKENVYNGVRYLTVQCLTEDTGSKIGECLSAYKKNKVKFFVLDLRDVFGGTYSSAKDIAKWFVPGTDMGFLKTKKSLIRLDVPKNENPWTGQMIIVVNKGTAKYGEILANALANDKDTVLVGEETMGDLQDVSMFDLGNGTGFTLTTGEYLPINNVKKVKPVLEFSADCNGKKIDADIIAKALEIINKGGKDK
ncbi:MAG: PDZ domain-containing protein [Armatimonadetes bacterium]|nr:PDZ domain-containing protein [Candidatus Hippobium faecium]